MASLSRRLVHRIAQWPVFAETDDVLLFWPLEGEVDLRPLMARFPQKHYYLPRIHEDAMRFYAYQPGDSVETNRYRIEEPLANAPLWVPGQREGRPLMLLPALMVDQKGTRLGYGKSFYDRFLEPYPGVFTLAAPVPEQLLTETLPRDSWDQPVEWIITPERIVPADR